MFVNNHTPKSSDDDIITIIISPGMENIAAMDIYLGDYNDNIL